MTLRFYTYLHRRATDGCVFYIGKGTGRRAHETSKGKRSAYWSSVVAKHGLTVEIVAYWASEDAAFAHERALIAEYREIGAVLCNLTDGGEGVSGATPSAETRAKISSANRRRVVTAESRAKLSAAKTGIKNTEETRAKISAANKGQIRTPESRAKISAARMGVKHTAETRAKCGVANKGKTASADTREKISRAKKGHPVSEATRAKMRASMHAAISRQKEAKKC